MQAATQEPSRVVSTACGSSEIRNSPWMMCPPPVGMIMLLQPSNDALDGLFQSHHVHWLAQIVVGARSACPDGNGRLPLARQEHEGHGGGRFAWLDGLQLLQAIRTYK